MKRRAALALFLAFVSGCGPSGGSTADTPTLPYNGPQLARLYDQHARDVWVECSGTVERVLRDDTNPPRHERFIVRVPGDDAGTVLVAHNIDLAPRVPIHAGDTVVLRGEYEFNPQGGVIHETHHAMSARDEPGGWVKFAGTTYR